jgi:hypothetical protein
MDKVRRMKKEDVMRSVREFRYALAIAIGILSLLSAIPAYSSHGGVLAGALAIDPVTPTTLYAATPGGVFKSTNGGASWSASGLSSVFSLVIDPLTPTTLYAGSYGVFKSTDGGASWNPTGGLPTWSPWVPAGAVATLAIDPQTPTTIYAGTLGSPIYIVGDFYRSLDGGQSWEGSYAVFMMSIACNPCGGIVALAAAPQTVLGVMAAFTSYGEDGSVYWEAPSQVTHGNLINPGFAVAIDPVTPTTLYAGTYKSTNDGATWFATGLTGVGGVQALAIDPLTPTTLYAGSLDAVHKSVDGGTTWIATGLTNVGGVRTLAIDPLTPTTLYAGTGTGGVYKSTNGGASWSPTGLITWSHISSLSLNPASVVGGSPATGTVTLNAPAPADGTLVQLSTGGPSIASVPSSVRVAAGATSADFVVSTNPVDASRNVLVWGGTGEDTSSAALTVTPGPATLSSLTLNPTSVAGGLAVTGTVTLNTAAPAGGAVVALSSSNPSVATVPAGVAVAAGATSAVFVASTSPVTNSTTVEISATYGGSDRSAALTVTPITTLSLFSLSPPSATAGNASSGTVTLSAPAPAGGAAVALSSNNTVATVPASVTVAAGATSATFKVSTSSVSGCASSVANISATYGGVIRSAGLTVTPATDTVAIQQADYFANRHELRVAATSTGSTATLRVYVTSTGELIGTLKPYDGNRYSGQFTWPVNPQNITVRSSLCGSATKTVTSK